MRGCVPVTLTFTGAQHARLKRHLLSGDGLEAAAAIALCGRRAGDRRHRLVVREIFEIPYAACSERTATRLTWPPDLQDDLA